MRIIIIQNIVSSALLFSILSFFSNTLGFYALFFTFIINSPIVMYHVKGTRMTSVRMDYTYFYNMKSRRLHIERTTFRNLITNAWVNMHFGCKVEASDLIGNLRGVKNVKEGDYFILTTKDHHLKESGINYAKVPYKITEKVDQEPFSKDQFLFRANSEETKLLKRIEIKKAYPLYNTLYHNCIQDVKFFDENYKD